MIEKNVFFHSQNKKCFLIMDFNSHDRLLFHTSVRNSIMSSSTSPTWTLPWPWPLFLHLFFLLSELEGPFMVWSIPSNCSIVSCKHVTPIPIKLQFIVVKALHINSRPMCDIYSSHLGSRKRFHLPMVRSTSFQCFHMVNGQKYLLLTLCFLYYSLTSNLALLSTSYKEVGLIASNLL